MKKIIIAAMAAAFTMISCNKEQLVESGNNTTGDECIITAYTEDNLTKTSLSGDDSKGYDVVWSKGDKISIGDNIFELTEGEGTTKGKFRGTLPADGTYTAHYGNYDFHRSHEQPYVEGNITGSPMSAEVTISGGQLTNPIKFKNDGGLLRLTLKGTATVHHLYFFANPTGDINIKCGDVPLNEEEGGAAFYIALPAGTYSSVGFEVTEPDGRTIKKTLKNDRKLVIERSKITTATVSGINATGPEGMLSGEFSIGEGRQVRFSRGNLRYSLATRSWSFFDRQYACGPSTYEEGHNIMISLFTWGYNSSNSIIPDGQHYDNVSRLTGDLDQSEDWGSRIGDGETWRTLTSAEWTYLFEGRNRAAEKYGYGTVCGVKGLMILPDTFPDPHTNESTVSPSTGNGAFIPQATNSQWTDNIYTNDGSWEAMVNAGVVFLPVAGIREGAEIRGFTDSDLFGRYWTSSTSSNHISSMGEHVYFTPWRLRIGETTRGTGLSVRLVTDLYTVTFDAKGKPVDWLPDPIKGIVRGATITRPSSPVAYGYTFTGWYKDKEGTIPWNFGTDVVTEDTTLYAGWANGVISAKFSVSEDKQVYFSCGNLWADNAGSLHFEDNQYSFNDEYETSHVSHFTWSSSLSAAVGTTGSGTNLFCDENHKVAVEGSAPVFYALSKDEWAYLLSRDDHTVDITYGGVKGILIYPDNYRQSRLDPGTVIESAADFPKGGAVFLPATGWRNGENVMKNDINKRCYGYYWSASSDTYISPYSLNFFCGGGSIEIDQPDGAVSFDSNEEETHGVVYISEPGNRNNALSIRLVTDVN